MKRILTITFLVIFAVSYAQPFRYAGKIGYVNSNIRASSLGFSQSFKAKSNVYLSSQAEYFFNQKFSAQAEITIAGLGANKVPMDIYSQGRTYEGNHDLHLATFSLSPSIKFYPDPKIGLLGGFNLSFMSNVFTEVEGGQRIKLTDFNSGNHSFFLGTECRIYRNLFIEARHNIGISDINPNPAVTMRNNYFQIGLGWYSIFL